MVKKKANKGWGKQVALGYIIAIIMIGLIMLSSCSPKLAPSHNVDTSHKDSTKVVEITGDSLVYIPIPLEKDQVIAHLGDTSKLETSLARSLAFIGNDGFLHHSLENKSEEKLPVIVPIHSKTIFTLVSDKHAEVITKYEYVEKPLSWWQKFRLGAFWWLVGAIVIALIWIFRKVIVKLV